MSSIKLTQAEFEAQLEALYKQFEDAKVPGETDEDIGNAILDLILRRERLRRGVDISGHAIVDRETLEKLANCTDSDDPILASTVGIVFGRLARGRHENAVKLLKKAIETRQKAFNEQQRAKAQLPRKKNPITILIGQIVESKSDITEAELLRELRRHGSVINEIDEGLGEITPFDTDFGSLKISGLKDILYKAKKSLKNK